MAANASVTISRLTCHFISPSSTAENRLTTDSVDTRLSMPFQSDESGSGPDEPDESVLAMARARHGNRMQVLENVTHGDVTMSSEGPYDIEDTSIEEQVENEDDDDAADREEPISLVDPADIGLKEISNLGKFIVSSHKPGNGIDELQSDDLKLFWQCVTSTSSMSSSEGAS